MRIIYSDIYKKYFPIVWKYTEFTEIEKKRLCLWAKRFKIDTKTNEFKKARYGPRYIITYNFDSYNVDEIINMIMNNQFDEQGLIAINSIIYSHKYTTLLSFYFFPILTTEHFNQLIKNNKNE